MFDALDTVKVALDHVYGPGKVSLADASIRWMYHHSILDGAHGGLQVNDLFVLFRFDISTSCKWSQENLTK